MKGIVILFIVLLVIIRAIQPFIRKHLLTKLSPIQLIIMGHIVWTIPFIYFIIDLSNKKKMNFFKKLNGFDYFLLGITVLLGVFTSIMYSTLLQKHNASFVVPIISSLTIVMVAVYGFLFFKEQIHWIDFIGVIAIAIGVFLLNLETKHKRYSKSDNFIHHK